MHTPIPSTGRSGQHPLIIAAAIAVILFCMAGTAAIMGWIPSSVGSNNKAETLSEFDRAALASKLAATAEREPRQEMLPAMSASRALAPERERELEPEPRQLTPVRVAEYKPTPKPAPARNWCSNCGNIESVREITQRGQGSGLGAAGGAVIGGLLGNQIGGGNGKKLATVAGAVGGAVVGNQVEGNMKATRSYEIRVRLDNGSTRTFKQQSAAGWRSGDRVKVVNGGLRSVH